MSDKAKRLLAVAIAVSSIAAVPLTSLALSGSAAGVPVACSGAGGGCE